LNSSDDCLVADLAWDKMESQFSPAETQMCAELHGVSKVCMWSPLGDGIYLPLPSGFRNQGTRTTRLTLDVVVMQ
jgi:hypothetical protein